ncbi:hypothetical protein CAEBREN_19564 [Caenorhabditis brenneri]|uniref:Uncharacterized protein n=1 Tax=Caenorhabditis brenneri TaxID=135651 RepID=G0MWV3_CAEBE|nr:hypothetical protein CAEBREN_19564 [Caenorhabditis brenneri]
MKFEALSSAKMR